MRRTQWDIDHPDHYDYIRRTFAARSLMDLPDDFVLRILPRTPKRVEDDRPAEAKDSSDL